MRLLSCHENVGCLIVSNVRIVDVGRVSVFLVLGFVSAGNISGLLILE
jgi:hypothetical protein